MTLSHATLANQHLSPQQWFPVNKGIENVTILSTAVNPTNHLFRYAGSETQGLFFMRDGVNWQAGDPQFIKHPIHKILVDPIMTSHVFMIVGNEENIDVTLYRSVDDGQTWQIPTIVYRTESDRQDPFLPVSMVFNPNYTNEMYAGDFFGRLWKSNDNGVTWNIIFSRENSFATINTIAINPKNPRIIYIGVRNWESKALMFKSDDRGLTWHAIPYPFQGKHIVAEIRTITLDPKNPNVIYAFLTNWGNDRFAQVFKSTNAGVDWQMIMNKFPDETIDEAIVDPYNTNIIYALSSFDVVGLTRGQVYISNDAGINWQLFIKGLPDRYGQYARVLLYNNDQLYVGMDKAGVYQMNL